MAPHLRPQRGPLPRVLVGRVDHDVVVDHDVEAVGGQRADDVEEAVVDAVVGQLLVADPVGRAVARDGLSMIRASAPSTRVRPFKVIALMQLVGHCRMAP